MKTAHVKNFRCIEDSEEFTVADVTCLVGKNESGKTSLLTALYRLNPHADEGPEVQPRAGLPTSQARGVGNTLAEIERCKADLADLAYRLA